jgi:hypothetical protein
MPLDLFALDPADADDEIVPATADDWLTASAWVFGTIVPWALIVCGMASAFHPG